MPYINTKTNTFGHNIYEVREAHPEASIPDGVDYGDFVWYAPTNPEYDPATHVAVETAPLGGVQQWRIDQLPPQPVVPKKFSSLDFLALFSDAEQIAIAQASMANMQIKLWYDKMLAAEFVTIADPRTGSGLDALMAMALLTPDRKAAITAAMVV